MRVLKGFRAFGLEELWVLGLRGFLGFWESRVQAFGLDLRRLRI